jgi:predicted 3-demethylubiquinone-9 3-methyltransferase (glyoxalase superfamily)
MSKVQPCLWMDDRIEEAVNFWVSTFKDAEIKSTNRYPDGRAMVVTFRLRDQDFMALNGGPQFPHTEAVSFYVSTKDQAETDYFWDTLTANGGAESNCGWLKDKYGLSWQIVPEALPRLMSGQNGAAAGQAMMKMRKIDIATLERAAAG